MANKNEAKAVVVPVIVSTLVILGFALSIRTFVLKGK